ncbi:MAG: peptidyl-prolyl cis-trans isomerase [Candidatus Aminicenantes bacterium]|nr:MAG: peptidyl-prolyl cis-trans isomerase [Candidatus Aminicenantes bacterium]
MNKIPLLIILTLFLVLLSGNFLSGQEVVDAIVAIVNDDIITVSDYMMEHDAIYQVLRAQLQGEEFTKQYEKEKEGLLERMITERLLLQEATRLDIQSTANVDEQIRMMVDNIKKQYNIASDEEFKRAMEQQGVDYGGWIAQQEKAIIQQALIFNEVGRSIAIDETDVVNYYDLHPEEFTTLPTYKLKGIYVSSEDKSEQEAQAKMEEVNEKLASGEELESLASQYSEGPEKESQGDIGTYKKGEMDKTLEEAVANLEEGSLSSWIQIPTGWFLLKLDEKTESQLRPFEEVKKDIENNLFMQEQQVRIQAYIKDLKKRSFINILIPDPLKYR